MFNTGILFLKKIEKKTIEEVEWELQRKRLHWNFIISFL